MALMPWKLNTAATALVEKSPMEGIISFTRLSVSLNFSPSEEVISHSLPCLDKSVGTKAELPEPREALSLS
ncbi:MAG: hypothetical protein DDT29_00343 [Dehalococcoidia bacterium]|nr:hypothetical protein [Bacillota bacterium]